MGIDSPHLGMQNRWESIAPLKTSKTQYVQNKLAKYGL